MGTKPPHPDTLEPEILQMIDSYVNHVMSDSTPPPPRGRLARASVASMPVDDSMAPPSVERAAELVRELAAAMAADAPEFVDETPTDLSSPPMHVAGDDEDTAVFPGRRR